ncbi:MAG: tetratricopeptide repeat protein [Betaproteobacteria bacterium]|nr:tetratricopeptide repeat protein [Betaproteobacteria bacterium]
MNAASATLQDTLQRAAGAFQRHAFVEAERWCRAALALRPDAFDALHILGLIGAQTGHMVEAHEWLGKAVRVFPGSPDCWNNLGLVQRELGRRLDALASFDRALAIAPNHGMAHNGRGVVLRDTGRIEEAVAAFDRAIASAPTFAEAHANRANALVELRRHDEAVPAYERAIELAPGTPFLAGGLAFARMNACDWAGLDTLQSSIAAGVARGDRVTIPFPTLGMPFSALAQRAAARAWAGHRPGEEPAAPAARAPGERIRLGYFSSDFHEHATAHLLAEVIERHDRARFHVTAFSWGPDTGDAMRKRLAAAFDDFVDVRGRTERDIASVAREKGIDVAIDLKGYALDERTGVFARRAAPVQVSWLGYPATTGAKHMDYFVADAVAMTPAIREAFDEQVVVLPGSFQPHDTRRGAVGDVPSREALGLPESGFVFCGFNAPWKINPPQFDRWMRILAAVPGSVLWLLETGPAVARNLCREATARGIDEARLVFAPRVSQQAHLARLAAAGLFLDTLPCNAHTGASDALWAGLPVLTCPGGTFAGRVAASVVTAAGLPELVASSPEAYEAEAIRLAHSREALAAIRGRVTAARASAPLFDTAAFTRHLESAFARMHERAAGGLAPEAFEVRP